MKALSVIRNNSSRHVRSASPANPFHAASAPLAVVSKSAPSAPRSFPQVQQRSIATAGKGYKGAELSDEEFVKVLRKPDQFFGQVVEGVQHDLRQFKEPLQGDVELRKLLSDSQMDDYRETLYTNLGMSKPVAANFLKSALGLPPMGASVYSHMFAGLSKYVADKQGMDVNEAIQIATYYRSPILVEEFHNLGYSDDQWREIVAKAFYLQYWSGAYKTDPLIFNPMLRSFYPQNSHLITGANDLGRETEFQAAKLFAMGLEGVEKPPVTIINTGDTGPFTDGAMHMLQHLMEAMEMGIKMPIIFLIHANNSSISTRLNMEDEAAGLRRIEQRFKSWGHLMGPGETTKAEDVVGGINSMRSAVDQVLETGKPTWRISSYPFRPLGHASDASPAGDALLLEQFKRFKTSLVKQISNTAKPGQTGADLADMLQESAAANERAVLYALEGNQILRRSEIEELSTGGLREIQADPGCIIDIPLNYMLGKGQKSGFAGMGADIYGKSFDKLFDQLDAEGRACRYVHQENHKPNKTDTRCGVYGELNQIKGKHLEEKFVAFLPQEAQIAQVGAGLRTVLPKDNVVFVKGPHTLFNEHAKDHMKYAAFRYYDCGEHANYIYLIDGGSLAVREKESLSSVDPFESVERDIVLARVGEHHNTPFYSGYAADANTVLATPLDANLLAAMLPYMVTLSDYGRLVITFCPTASFGQLHTNVDLGGRGVGTGALKDNLAVTQNDVLRVEVPGVKPKNGRTLVVVAWGPDAKMVTQTLVKQGVEATVFILSYMKTPNALVSHLRQLAQAGVETEVMAVDPNPEAMLIAPVMTMLRSALEYPEILHFSECTVTPTFVPYGVGESLLRSSDLKRLLAVRGLIENQGEYTFAAQPTAKAPQVTADPHAATAAPAASASGVAGGEPEIIFAPMEAENAQVKYHKQAGDEVEMDELIAEVESDKAVVEITAPCRGTVGEYHVAEGKEVNLTMESKIVSIIPKVGGTSATPPVAPAAATSTPASAAGKSSPSGTATAESNDCMDSISLSKMQRTMVKNMCVQVGDTLTYGVTEPVKFQPLIDWCKTKQISPVNGLMRVLAESVHELGMNKKLSADKSHMQSYNKGKVDIGMAIEVDKQLRVAVIRDILNKSDKDVQNDIELFKQKGAHLSPEDQNLDNVCYILTSLGKNAPIQATPTLPRGISGILAIGRTGADGYSQFTFTLCHATLTGSEGASLLMDISNRTAKLGDLKTDNVETTSAPSKRYSPGIKFPPRGK